MLGCVDTIINEINQLDNPAQRKNRLPDDGLIAKYELATGSQFTEDCSFASRFHPGLHFAVSLFRYRYSSFINGFPADEWISVK